jgi:hypothetical protein
VARQRRPHTTEPVHVDRLARPARLRLEFKQLTVGLVDEAIGLAGARQRLGVSLVKDVLPAKGSTAYLPNLASRATAEPADGLQASLARSLSSACRRGRLGPYGAACVGLL